MENLDPIVDTQDPVAPAPVAPVAPPVVGWKSSLSTDLKNAPTLQKFDDTPEGLNKAVESHLSLEKLLGNEKVPIPKGPDDREGWSRYNKAFGIPDKPDGYQLADVQIPESMKGLTFDKSKFAEVIHSIHATPDQAKGLWNAYTKMSQDAYTRISEEYKTKVAEGINTLRSEWGDAYEGNVDLGQTVINKFAGSKEEADEISATLLGSPTGIKFLAKIGSQFAENKIGEFSAKRFAKSPEEAQAEVDSILRDPNHPYLNDKAPAAEHKKAVDYVNSLIAVVEKSKRQATI